MYREDLEEQYPVPVQKRYNFSPVGRFTVGEMPQANNRVGSLEGIRFMMQVLGYSLMGKIKSRFQPFRGLPSDFTLGPFWSQPKVTGVDREMAMMGAALKSRSAAQSPDASDHDVARWEKFWKPYVDQRLGGL